MSMMVFVVVAVVLLLCNHMGWIEASNSKQYFQGDVAPRGLDDPYSAQMMIDPLLDHLKVLRTDKIDLVQHDQVRKADLAQLEHVQPFIAAGAASPTIAALRDQIASFVTLMTTRSMPKMKRPSQ